jgi:hypothetical protein
MTDTDIITPVTTKVLNSMKEQENVTAVVQADHVLKLDPEKKFRFTGKSWLTKNGQADSEGEPPAFDETQPLTLDINLLKMCRVEDLYRD